MSDNQSVSLEIVKQLLAEQAKQNAENIERIIKTIKEPTQLEQQELDKLANQLKQANESRRRTANEVKQAMEGKKMLQRICSHQHGDAARGTHLVYVQEKNGTGYLLCQKNQCKIRPEPAPAGYTGSDFYSTAEFNRLFQTLPSRGEIFG